MNTITHDLAGYDPEIFETIKKETSRQAEKLELIASENFVSYAVIQALGSTLTNKYAEGYPGKRYYGGCEYVDMAENLARDRAKELFGAEYVNVQPHSGSQAKHGSIFHTRKKPGDKVMGMDLSHGGHLTHGSPVNFSGQLYDFTQYGINPETEMLDYDLIEQVAIKEKPKMITVGASAYSRNIDYKKFREIADKIGAFLFADIAHPAGLIAKKKLLNDPVPHCHVVATTTHKTLRGPRGGMIMIGKDFENPFGKVAPKSGRVKMMSELLDSMVMPGIQGGPLMHVIAGKAVAFKEALEDNFLVYAKQVIKNAQALANKLISYDYKVISGGTDNHLMLIDLRNKEVSGKAAEEALDSIGITCNKNSVPYDDKSPLVTSGIRLGTPALTTRGMKEAEMEIIADLINRVVTNHKDEKVKKEVSREVSELTSKFKLYDDLKIG
jgi:glycine hydroxymethyltransferase